MHLQRVTKCPPNFPAGSYWYGSRRDGPGRPPEWVNKIVQADDAEECSPEDADEDDRVQDEDDRVQDVEQLRVGRYRSTTWGQDSDKD